MASKARLFHDEATLSLILSVDDPRDAKALGRKVKNFKEAVWRKEAPRLVVEGNIEKFSQDTELKEFLLTTGDAVLAEASPVDTVWGIGLREDDERAKHPKNWQGSNLLGFALMEVRERLRDCDGP